MSHDNNKCSHFHGGRQHVTLQYLHFEYSCERRGQYVQCRPVNVWQCDRSSSVSPLSSVQLTLTRWQYTDDITDWAPYTACSVQHATTNRQCSHQSTLTTQHNDDDSDINGPNANLKGCYFQPSLSVCLCVCLCVSDQHFYPSMLTDFHETWSQRHYCDLVWPRP